MQDDMYRETALQRIARLLWNTAFAEKSVQVTYVYVGLWLTSVLMFAAALFVPSGAIIATAVTLLISAVVLVVVYSFAQAEAMRYQWSFVSDGDPDEVDTSQEAKVVYESSLPDDEFVQARDAILAEADRRSVAIDPDAQWQQMVDFARCSPEEFELALAEFVQVDK